jgi:hypothetical protein
MASTTPPNEPGTPGTPGMPGTPTPGTPGPGPGPDPGPARTGPAVGYTQLSNFDVARMPIPGNAEFLFFVAAMLLLALIALIADSFDTPGWVEVFKWLGAAYIISRGIAKASRVLEQ